MVAFLIGNTMGFTELNALNYKSLFIRKSSSYIRF